MTSTVSDASVECRHYRDQLNYLVGMYESTFSLIRNFERYGDPSIASYRDTCASKTGSATRDRERMWYLLEFNNMKRAYNEERYDKVKKRRQDLRMVIKAMAEAGADALAELKDEEADFRVKRRYATTEELFELFAETVKRGEKWEGSEKARYPLVAVEDFGSRAALKFD